MLTRFIKQLQSGLSGAKSKPVQRKPFKRTVLNLESLEVREAPAAGLVAAYNFDQGVGSVLADLSGNGNNGKISGATWSSNGHSGKALYFNGANALVSVADNAALRLTSGMTLEAWVSSSSISNVWRDIVSKGKDNYFLEATSSTRNAPAGGGTFAPTSKKAVVTGASGLVANAWTHLAVTYDGAWIRLFVNGVEVANQQQSGKLTTSGNALQLGANSLLKRYFKGYIDDVRIYNGALTADQIVADMNAPVADTGLPTVSVTGPTNGAAVTGTITISAKASDNVGVAGVQFYLDGNALGNEDTSSPYSLSWDSRTVANGTHTLVAKARDAAGNISTSSIIQIHVTNVDSIAPTISLASPLNGAQVSGTVTVSANASDNFGVVGVQFYLDGNALGTENTTSPYSISWDSSSVADGTHTLMAKARDAAGNIGTSSTITVTVGNGDIVTPTVQLTAPMDGATVGGTITISADANDNVGVVGVQFYLDGNALGSEDTTNPYSLSWNTATVANGTHTLMAKARDAAGNIGSSTTIQLTVDNSDSIAPTVSITAPGNNATVSGTISVSANASDNVGVVGVQFYLDGNALGNESTMSPYSTSWNTTMVANGTHTLMAKARDAAGNIGSSSTIQIVVSNSDNISPTVSLTAPTNNATVSGSITISANANDNIGVVGVQFYLDGNALGSEDTTNPYSMSWNTATVANGTHTLMAKARDAAGNIGSSSTIQVIVSNGDTTSPTVSITAPANNATVAGTITVSANANDNVGVVGVQFYLDGSALGSEDTTNPYSISWNTAAVSNGTHTLMAKARDAAGNIGTSSTISITVNNGDTISPTVSLTAPANNATVSGTITVSANASDNVGVVGVQFYLDGNALGSEDTSSPYSISWNTTTASNGTHTLVAKARDAAGNLGTSSTFTVTVSNDITSPTVSISAPANNATVSGTITVSANASDNVGVVGVQFYLDGNALGSEDTTSPYSVSWNTATVTNGTHTLYAKARDAAGNLGTSSTITVTVSNDSIAPTVSVTAPANNATVSGTITVSANASDNVGVVGVQFYLDGNTLGAEDTSSPYSLSWNTTTVSDGTHTIVAKARDAAGNIGTSSTITVTVSNDSTAPTVSVTAPANNATVTGTITVSANASDNVGVVGVQFYLDGNALSNEDTTSPYSVSWNTATVGNGTHTLFAKARDAAGNIGTSSTITVTVSNSSGGNIVTPWDTIPNFGANPTIVSAVSGNWSSAATWSGNRTPTANDVVSIGAGTVVTYDVTMANTDAVKTVAIQPGGKLIFRTDVSTTLYVTNLLVLEGGELDVGTAANPVATNVTASIIFPNKPIDTTNDPLQYGDGLIALGKVTMYGAVKSSFIRLAAEAMAGATTLTLSEGATGWRVGDKLVVPDSKQWAIQSESYVPEYEEATIAAISGDGRTITLAAPLQFNHPGARNGDGVLEFLPVIGNRTRNVTVRSESATGTRGHAMFTWHADVDVRYASFAGLGRTTIDPIDAVTNVDGRFPVQFANVMGPQSTPANGYQYTFIGNAVFCPMPNNRFKWGVTVNNSHYGLIQDNFIYNWGGAGFVALKGNESYNVIDHNFVERGIGEGDKDGKGNEGVAFWFRGFNNYVRNNIGANYVGNTPEAAYGYKFWGTYLGNVRIPNYKGADTSISGQYTIKDGNSMPLLEFSGNEAFGVENALTFYWLNTLDTVPQNGPASTVSNFTGWHVSRYGFYGYNLSNVTFDGFTIRGNKSVLSNGFESLIGMWFGDYVGNQITIRNANIQGTRTGIIDPYFGGTTTTIENSYLRNSTDISIQNLGAPGSSPNGANRQPKSMIIRNVQFGSTAGWNLGDKTPYTIAMDYTTHNDSANLQKSDTVFVQDYNGVTGDNFRVFYNEQAPSFIMPPSSGNLVASPQAGLTNQQLWNQYGIALAGELATNTTTRSGIKGLVR